MNYFSGKMNIDIQQFIDELASEFRRTSDSAIAAQQQAYKLNQFEFFGLKAPVRRELHEPFLQKEYLPDLDLIPTYMEMLWSKPEREFQLFGLDLALKYKKKLRVADIEWMEYMILNKSWWDTVDTVAAHMVGAYLTTFPEQRDLCIPRWMKSGNMWLQRVCLIFQLKYKDKADQELLASLINQLLGSKEFFINKAIGWSLREYGKVNPEWVVDIVNKSELSPLRRRAALKQIY